MLLEHRREQRQDAKADGAREGGKGVPADGAEEEVMGLASCVCVIVWVSDAVFILKVARS